MSKFLKISVRGEMFSPSALARKTGIQVVTLYARIEAGHNIETVLSPIPLKKLNSEILSSWKKKFWSFDSNEDLFKYILSLSSSIDSGKRAKFEIDGKLLSYQEIASLKSSDIINENSVRQNIQKYGESSALNSIRKFAFYHGKWCSAAEISSAENIPSRILYTRKSRGASGEKLWAPVRKAKKIEFRGKLQTVAEISKLSGESGRTIRARYSNGFRGEDLVKSQR